jgi:hypothetical protein
MTPNPNCGLTELATLASSASSNGTTSTNDGGDSRTKNTDYGEEEFTQVAPFKHQIEDATLKDIECIDEDKNEALLLVQFGKRGGSENRTKIKTILGHSITYLPVPVLKKFCINNNIFDENGSTLRRSPKHVICDRIMWYLVNENEADQM